MIKELQRFYLYSYRSIGFIFLFGLTSSIAWYGFSILFFMSNSSWSVPLILSPGQEKVITHLEHLLNLEQQLTIDVSQLRSDSRVLQQKIQLLKKAKLFQQRMKKSITLQSQQYLKSSQVFQQLTIEKTKNVNELSELTVDLDTKLALIKKELHLGLITKQEALTQQLALESLQTSLIDARARVQEFSQRSMDFSSAAKTLRGASNNLLAMNNLAKKVELDTRISELKMDIFTLKLTIQHLEKNIEKRKQALHMMKKNPYILATKKSTMVSFVPYKNIKNISVGTRVYSCHLDMIACYQSGRVNAVYKAEEYGKHPIFRSEIKGRFIRIAYDNEKDAQKKLLFLHRKPLLF